MSILEDTYGLIDEPSEELWGQDFETITASEHLKNIQPWLEEEQRLIENGSKPPLEVDRNTPIKKYGDTEGITLADLQKKWNEAPAKGSATLYTNVAEAGEAAEKQGKEVRYYGGSSASEGNKIRGGIDPNTFDPNNAFVQALKEQVASLAENAEDPLAYAEKRAQIAASMSAKEAEFKEQATAQARARFAVADYEKLVALTKQREQRNPEFRATYGSADGPETLAAKQRLAQAYNQADGAVPEILAGNANYQALSAYSRTYVQTEDERIRKDIATKAGLDAEAEELLFSLTPDQRDNLAKLTGSTDVRNQAAFLRAQKGKDRQDLQRALAGGSENLPVQALTGNRFAKQLVAGNEAKVFGAEATSKINELEAITQNQPAADVAFAEMKAAGYLDPEKLAQWEQQKAAALAGLHGSKEQQGEAASMRLQIAATYAKYKTEREFLGDVVALQNRAATPAPDWIIQEAEKSGPVSKAKALDLISQAGTPEEKKARMEELVNYYKEAVKKQNDSSLFKVDARLIPQLEAEAALRVAGIDWRTNQSIAGRTYRALGEVGGAIKETATGLADDVTAGALFVPNYLAELLGAEDPSMDRAAQKGRIFDSRKKFSPDGYSTDAIFGARK